MPSYDQSSKVKTRSDRPALVRQGAVVLSPPTTIHKVSTVPMVPKAPRIQKHFSRINRSLIRNQLRMMELQLKLLVELFEASVYEDTEDLPENVVYGGPDTILVEEDDGTSDEDTVEYNADDDIEAEINALLRGDTIDPQPVRDPGLSEELSAELSAEIDALLNSSSYVDNED